MKRKKIKKLKLRKTENVFTKPVTFDKMDFVLLV